MFSATTVGRVTAALEVKHSENKKPYICFNLAVQKGYGINAHTIFPQCWIFGEEKVNRILNAKVGKGSLLQVSGDIDLVQHKHTYGEEKGQTATIIKLLVWDWGYVPGEKHKGKEGFVQEINHTPASLDDFEVVNDDSLPV